MNSSKDKKNTILPDGEERAGCFAWFVILLSRDGWAALPRGAMELFAVCDCGIS